MGPDAAMGSCSDTPMTDELSLGGLGGAGRGEARRRLRCEKRRAKGELRGERREAKQESRMWGGGRQRKMQQGRFLFFVCFAFFEA